MRLIPSSFLLLFLLNILLQSLDSTDLVSTVLVESVIAAFLLFHKEDVLALLIKQDWSDLRLQGELILCLKNLAGSGRIVVHHDCQKVLVGLSSIVLVLIVEDLGASKDYDSLNLSMSVVVNLLTCIEKLSVQEEGGVVIIHLNSFPQCILVEIT